MTWQGKRHKPLPLPFIGLLLGLGMGMLLAVAVVIGGAPVEPALLGIVAVVGAYGLFAGLTA